MHLILMRHADALEGSNDLKRELSKKGRRQAKLMAKWIGDHANASFEVWSSPAVRAVQTVEPINAKINIKKHLSPTAGVKTVLREIETTGYGKDLLVCGHMPWIALVGQHYLESNQYSTSLNFKKGGILWIEITNMGNYLEKRLMCFINPQDLG